MFLSADCTKQKISVTNPMSAEPEAMSGLKMAFAADRRGCERAISLQNCCADRMTSKVTTLLPLERTVQMTYSC